MSLTLIDFVRQLADDMVLAPIYRKGAVMRSGATAKGKNPHEDGHDRNLGKHDAALLIEKHPKTLTAVGLWTGVRGNGYVILDVDRNHSALKKKWGEALQGAPVITSTKKNAAKYIFRVPEALWKDVDGFGLSEDTGHAYEVLWGRQGLVYGAYPGSHDGKAPEGSYGFEGDPDSIPDAPDFLIAEMKAAKAKEGKGFISNRKALDVSDRTEDEIAQIIQECLKVVPHQGVGSNEHWVKVGMAIHSVLPNEQGLTLWSAWSAEDPEYADEWKRGNPCQGRWKSFKPGGIGLGTLIWMADRVDPKRARFSESSKSIVETAEANCPVRFLKYSLDHKQIIAEAKRIQTLDNPSEANHRMSQLADAAGYKDRTSIEQLLLDQITYERRVDRMTVKQLLDQDFNRGYVIPDVLPSPSVVLLYGPGGEGKSMSAWTIAKHVATGTPFVVRGRLMPVKQGPVLILNGDQSLPQLQEQLMEVGMPANAPVHIQPNWHLKYMSRFIEMMDEIKPALVLIDSLIGCSGGSAFDENKSEFASPLYWLSNNNGSAFPATTVMIIHHANKQGGFRGTSAIRDAVDETWALKRPSKEQAERDPSASNTRFITVEKSRSGRSGMSLAMRMEADLSFSLSDATPEIDQTKTTPDAIIDRVLMKIRTIYPRTITRKDLNADPLVGGNLEGIKKALQRLEKSGLITSQVAPGGKREKHFLAVLSHTRGEGTEVVPSSQNPSPGTHLRGDNLGGQPQNEVPCPPKSSTGDNNPENELVPPTCPPKEPSAGAGSEQRGQLETYPHAREEASERSRGDLKRMSEEASKLWE
jgi:hypothetical protein